MKKNNQQNSPAIFINKVVIQGIVGMKRQSQAPDGSSMYSISVVTDRGFRRKDGEYYIETTWHNVRAYPGKDCPEQMLQNLGRGDAVHIEGRLRTINVATESGDTRQITEIVAQKIDVLPPASGEAPRLQLQISND